MARERRRAAPACALFVAAIAAVLLLAFPALASASPGTFVVMLSDGHDWIGGGEPRLFHPGNGSISITGNAGYLTVHVAGGTQGDSYAMEFAAPDGETLHQGLYLNAQRATFRGAGRPGIDIHGSGRGCNQIAGMFEVKDIAVEAGTVTRFWALYEQHCEGDRPALFGEVRFGEPLSGDPALVAPQTIRWPAGDAGFSSTVVPAWVTAVDDSVTLTGASIVGAAASSFTIRSDECSGRTLQVGESCQIFIRFVPADAGTKLAALRLSGPGTERDVELQGFAFGGQTRVDMASDPGDYIGQGRPWHYTVATGLIEAWGTRQRVTFSIDGNDATYWTADFAAAPGDILAPGTYLNATRYPFNGNGPGMDVSGNGRGCNQLTGQFTVNSTAWWTDGNVRSFSVTFEQHCEGGTPARTSA